MLSEQNVSVLQAKFEQMSELDFTKKVVIPILKEMGFKSDYFGGPYEEGKDIILWKTDVFGETECGVAQVKKIRPSVSTRDDSSFSDLVNQLQQATEKTIPNLDGNKYSPKRVLFITPYDVNTRAVQSRFEKYRELKPLGVTILDGTRVAELLISRCPEVARALMGHAAAVASSTLMHLSNEILMQALSVSRARNIGDFYCDLEFAIGKRTNKLLHANTISVSKTSVEPTGDHLADLVAADRELLDISGIKLMSTSEKSIEQQRVAYRRDLESQAETQLVEVTKASGWHPLDSKTMSVTTASHEALRQPWKVLYSDAWARLEVQRQRIRELLVARPHPKAYLVKGFFHLLDLHKQGKKHFEQALRIRDSSQNVLRKIQKERVLSKAFLAPLRAAHSEVCRLVVEYRQFVARHRPLSYKIDLNLVQVQAWISTKKSWLLNCVQKINSGKLSGASLKKFLQDANAVLRACDKLLGVQCISELLVEPSAPSALLAHGPSLGVTVDPQFTVHTTVNKFFETGLNFAIFGEAGAGKTTTLQMYAKKLIDADHDRLVLFLPLASATAAFRRRSSDYVLTQSKAWSLLLQGICSVVNQNEQRPSLGATDLGRLLDARRSVLLLDGIDEVIKACPWILDAITQLSSTFPKAQILTSSRQSGEFLERVPFVGITIRNFTEPQRDRFISQWFACAEDPVSGKERAKAILAHLRGNRSIAEIITNPLSATILCVLAENDVPLPEREVHLYRERMRLLLGEYDRHKDVRRVQSHPDLLDKVAVKLAFFLHSHNSRQEAMSDLEAEALRIFEGRAKPDAVRKAVQELADPCNVFVPMNFQGDYGFGHLRFQEYLAACELAANRNVNLSDLLYYDWWRGPMVLLAQMTDDLEFLFSGALDTSRLSEALPTLNAMLVNRSEQDIRRLDEWLRQQEIQNQKQDEEPEQDGQGGYQASDSEHARWDNDFVRSVGSIEDLADLTDRLADGPP
jgi:hypothetical protein